tara:strand:- start:39 stop:650 length:612 start_codon:yes stop_codon:yes gene_type:complete
MSKKSRKRNKKILGALGAALAGAMLLGRGKPNMNIPDRGRGELPKGIDKVISDVPVSTPTTIQDSMPRVGMKMGDIRPKNPLSKRVMNDGRVFTIKGAKEGKAPVIGNPNTKFVSGKNIFVGGKPFTKATLKAKREMDAGMLPPQLRVPKVRTPVINDAFSPLIDDAMAKDGGKIVKTETGGKAVRPKKIKRIQIRGFGKARR